MIIKAEFKINGLDIGKSYVPREYLQSVRDKFAADLGVKLSPLFQKIERRDGTGDSCERLDIAIFTKDQFKALYSAIAYGQTAKALEILESNIPEIKLDNP